MAIHLGGMLAVLTAVLSNDSDEDEADHIRKDVTDTEIELLEKNIRNLVEVRAGSCHFRDTP